VITGKTVIFEIAMAKMFEINNDKIPCKAVYIAPLKSLVNEKYRDWQMKFSKIGKRVSHIFLYLQWIKLHWCAITLTK